MKTIIIAVLFCLLFSCCRDKVTSPGIQAENLISNSSFELNGIHSFAGWNISNDDSNFVSFSTDVPEGGGSFSAVIRTEWGPPYTIQTTVPIEPGSNNYELSCWGKIEGAGGAVLLFQQKQDTSLLLSQTNISDTSWKEYVSTVQITAGTSDSLKVVLQGGISQLLPGLTKFDLCRLEKVR